MIVRRLGKLWEQMRNAVQNEPRDLEFQAELEEHVRLLAERYRRQGMTSEAAMLTARRQFGNTTLLQEDLRAMQMIPAIEALRSDLTYAVRMLRRNPGFAATALITLRSVLVRIPLFSACAVQCFSSRFPMLSRSALLCFRNACPTASCPQSRRQISSIGETEAGRSAGWRR